jgi:hypothetical protein
MAAPRPGALDRVFSAYDAATGTQLWKTRLNESCRRASKFGFVLPVVIDVDSRVIAGWGLAVAAKRLGLTEVPVQQSTVCGSAVDPPGPLPDRGTLMC